MSLCEFDFFGGCSQNQYEDIKLVSLLLHEWRRGRGPGSDILGSKLGLCTLSDESPHLKNNLTSLGPLSFSVIWELTVVLRWLNQERVCLQCRSRGRLWFNLWVRKMPGGGNDNPLQYSCLKKSHGQRSLLSYSPKGCKESDTTEAAEYRAYSSSTECWSYRGVTQISHFILWPGTCSENFNSYFNYF